eukprot:Seg2175.3 transcript_id=Seg2175.3/GoldUCD/mRNA.D3Y31 product="hypothetical protein" protein_id=Seg2175.3/GoldUCD/D3Y31
MADRVKGNESKRGKKTPEKTPPISKGLTKNVASSVERLSQPKQRRISTTVKKRNDEKLRMSRERLEMTSPTSLVKLTPRSPTSPVGLTPKTSNEVIFRVDKIEQSNLKEGEVFDRSLTDVADWCENSDHLTPTPPKMRGNLSRDLAASVERLSKPKSRRKVMHQNRLSLNLEEQWKSLEEAFQSGLQPPNSPKRYESELSTPSSSRESICSQSTTTSFGSRSSVYNPNRSSGYRKRLGSESEERGKLKVDSAFGRRKARSERMLASMDNLNSAIHGKGFHGSKSLSPNNPIPPTRVSSKRTVSADQIPNVVSRLTAPTLSSARKQRHGSETKLERAPSNKSLASTKEKTRKLSQQPRRSRSSMSVRSKENEDNIGTKIKSLAGMFVFIFKML